MCYQRTPEDKRKTQGHRSRKLKKSQRIKLRSPEDKRKTKNEFKRNKCIFKLSKGTNF